MSSYTDPSYLKGLPKVGGAARKIETAITAYQEGLQRVLA